MYKYHCFLIFISALILQNVAPICGFNVLQAPSSSSSSSPTHLSYHHNHHDKTSSHDSISFYQHHQNKKIRTLLNMGLFDFFRSRENDFVKLETTSAYGPGPVIILYNVPKGILDEEIQDMIDDGMSDINCKYVRLTTNDLDWIGQMTVKDLLEKALSSNNDSLVDTSNRPLGAEEEKLSTTSMIDSNNNIPIIYFSGISNEAMMQTYNIIGREIYEESEGILNTACAKAVEPAMNKPFRQLIEEISGDHTDATQQDE